jgi:hypothetical protein
LLSEVDVLSLSYLSFPRKRESTRVATLLDCCFRSNDIANRVSLSKNMLIRERPTRKMNLQNKVVSGTWCNGSTPRSHRGNEGSIPFVSTSCPAGSARKSGRLSTQDESFRSLYSTLSTRACQEASITFSETPTVPQIEFLSIDWMMTRTRAAVPALALTTRTL